MKRILFFIALISTTWQQESTETLDETLDRLIKQASLGGQPKNVTTIPNTKNTSRMFFFNSPESKATPQEETKPKELSKNTSDDSQPSIADVLRALGIKDPVKETVDDDIHELTETDNTKDLTNTEEINTEPSKANTEDTELQRLLEQLSKSGKLRRSGDASETSLWNFNPDTGEDHKYPEIIIDKVTYHNKKKASTTQAGGKQNGSRTKALTEESQGKKTTNKNLMSSLDVANELKALLDELQNMKTVETTTETNIPRSNFENLMPQLRSGQENIQQPCDNAVMAYASPCKTALLDKLLDYQTTLNRDQDVDGNVQLNMFGARTGGAGQNALMRIAMVQKLRRLHFMRQLVNNMMPRFIYRPLYGYY